MFEAGDEGEFDLEVLLPGGFGVFGGEVAGKFTFAGEGDFLRDHEADVAGGFGAEGGAGPGAAVGIEAGGEDGVGEAGGLGGALAGGLVAFLGGEDFRVGGEGFAEELLEIAGLGEGHSEGGEEDGEELHLLK